MAEQLLLLDCDKDEFRLDEHTREVGRRGVAEARRRLAEEDRAGPPPSGPRAAWPSRRRRSDR